MLQSPRPPFLVGVVVLETRALTNNCSRADVLGSVAFTTIKKDMLGNIQVCCILFLLQSLYLIQKPKKVRDRHLAAPLESTTLQKLAKAELATKEHRATEGLLWLVRGLDFCAQALRIDIETGGSQELATSFRGAYKTTLAPYHSFLVKPVFAAAMSATPYRKDFAVKVAGDSSNIPKAEEDMKVWVAALEERVAILKAFLDTKEAKW